MKFFKWLKGLFENWKLKLLRLLAFIGSLAVFVCMQAVSISHTLALAEAHQYHGWEAIAFVAGVEIAFVVGLLLIILDRAHGRPLNLGTIVFFFIPTMVVGAANLRSGMGYGVVGLALGVVPPSLVLAVEKVLTNTSTNQPAKRKGWGWLAWIFGQRSASDQPTGQPVAESTNQNSQPVADQQPAVSQTAKVSQPETATQPGSTSQPASQVVESASDQPTISHSAKIDQPAANRSTTSASESQPGKQPVNQSASQQPTKGMEVDQPDLFNQPEATKPEKQSVTQPASGSAKPTNRVAKSTIQPTAKMVEAAKEYFRENGKWPSERQLAGKFGTSKHQAGKVLDTLDDSRKNYKAVNQPAEALAD